MEKQTTIKDIAIALNISTSTVSRALRDAPDVKAETKAAVKALSDKLDYQPNRLALSLLNRQTNTIGVIIPNLDYVLATMVKGIDEVALEAGYTVMVCQSDESYGREIVNTKRLLDSLVDGFIVSVSSETKIFEHIKKIQDKKIPLVLFDRIVNNIAAPKIRVTFDEMRLKMPAGIAAKNPTIPAVTPNFALASTKLLSALMSAGNRADFETRYVLLSTIAKNANGKSNSESSCDTIKTITTALNAAINKTKRRRPPGIRSITGPMNFAKIKNGAKLTAKNNSTRPRASPGVIDRNNESARATAMVASPAAMRACTRTKRVNGLI